MAAGTLTLPDGPAVPPGATAPPAMSPEQAQELEARRRTQTKVRWELLTGMVRKDLKLKYQGSVLGFVWSLVNPLFLLGVYGFVFGVVLGTGIPTFPIYVMSGLLTWNLFAGSLGSATASVTANAGLVKKVRFPLQVLPLSAVGFAAVHYVLQMGVLLAVIGVIRYDGIGLSLLLAVPAIVLAIVFTSACCFLVSALNVRYRDTAHLVELALIAWFWLTPCIYSSGLIGSLIGKYGGPSWLYRAYFADPMAIVVGTMQRALYGNDLATTPGPNGIRVLPATGYTFYLEQMAVAGVFSVVLLVLARRLFRRMQADFAEEL